MSATPGAGAQAVLGIDPGTLRLGWGIVRREGTRLVHVAHDVIRVKDELSLGERLVILERELVLVLERHAVSGAAIEQLFFAKDAQAAAKLGHARGVALLVCARAGLDAFEYPPAQVKRTVAGNGRADKRQVAEMMRVILRLPSAPPSDAADALAVAATHIQSLPLRAAAAASAQRIALAAARR